METKKKCKRGTRRNKDTGECETFVKKIATTLKIKREKRYERGTRRNSVSKLCEPIKYSSTKTRVLSFIKSPSPSLFSQKYPSVRSQSPSPFSRKSSISASPFSRKFPSVNRLFQNKPNSFVNASPFSRKSSISASPFSRKFPSVNRLFQNKPNSFVNASPFSQKSPPLKEPTTFYQQSKSFSPLTPLKSIFSQKPFLKSKSKSLTKKRPMRNLASQHFPSEHHAEEHHPEEHHPEEHNMI